MKNLFYKSLTALCLGLMLFVAFQTGTAFAVGTGLGLIMPYLSHFALPNAALFVVPWMVDGKFKRLSAKDTADLEDDALLDYKDAEVENLELELKEIKDAHGANKEEIAKLNEEIQKGKDERYTQLKGILKTQGEEIAKLKSTDSPDKAGNALTKALKESELSVLKKKGSNVTVKADATFADLTHTGQLDQVATGISDIVAKTPKMQDLFNVIPMITETYSYLQQATVDRDAKGVAKCAKGFTSLTKEEIEAVRVNYVKYKDTVDICRDYAEDYGFVESRYRKLINESVAFLVDTEIIYGTDTATSMNSIDNVSSEFSATNVDAPIGANIQDANMVDLILGMAAQIDTLGKLNHFRSNAVLVNRMDWFVKVESRKDADGNYIDSRVSREGNNIYIGGMLVIPHVDVVTNTLYVMDTTKADILDRRQLEISMSDSNGTNFVDEYFTMLATIKLQFLVENNNANAFMKCSDVDTAVDAINKL